MPFQGGTESQDLPTVRKMRRPGRLPAVEKNFRLAQDSSSKGNFERLDTIGPARVATRLEAEGITRASGRSAPSPTVSF